MMINLLPCRTCGQFPTISHNTQSENRGERWHIACWNRRCKSRDTTYAVETIEIAAEKWNKMESMPEESAATCRNCLYSGTRENKNTGEHECFCTLKWSMENGRPAQEELHSCPMAERCDYKERAFFEAKKNLLKKKEANNELD